MSLNNFFHFLPCSFFNKFLLLNLIIPMYLDAFLKGFVEIHDSPTAKSNKHCTFLLPKMKINMSKIYVNKKYQYITKYV